LELIGGNVINYKILTTAIGEMLAAESNGRVRLLEFIDGRSPKTVLSILKRSFGGETIESSSPSLEELEGQLSLYFSGKLRAFDLQLSFEGTDFQKKVWNKLCEIPYGHTVSYSWIAARIGCPQAFRAVGRANGSNRIAIVIPCHRVIGSNGQLVGYGGKLWRKKWLLEHEGALQAETI
jgi:O-6-methylguanine DNA methyltransferase